MATTKGNVIVGQSGGPTAVINSSLAGVYKTAKDRGAKKIYGMLHGIQGLLEERYVDLSKHITSDLDIELLKRTPSSYLGSCRYKLPEIKENTEIYDKIFGILNKLNVECFIYIGGNDSMDTIKKLSDYAILTGQTQKFVGVPKTIDNDLAGTDHTPGFGSAAKYIGSITKEVIRDGLVYDQQSVTILEIMGRNAGWLTGAAALAKCEDCEGPDMIFLPEITFDVDEFMRKVADLHKKKKSVVVAVSEGVRVADGRYVCELTDGIDYVDAMDRFGDNAELYERLALKYLDDGHLVALQAAMEAKDYSEGYSQAHALKGVAGNLSFKDLYECAALVSDALYAGEYEAAAKHLPEVERAHALVIEGLEDWRDDTL